MENEERVHHGSEDQPLDINPKDVDFKDSAKIDHARPTTKVTESTIIRDAHQVPADEQMIPMSQIDEGTKALLSEQEKAEEDNEEIEKM